MIPRLLGAAGLSALCGVLLAALVFPLVGGLGLAAKVSTEGFLALPTDLGVAAPATRSTVLAADGSVLASFYRVNRVEAPFSSIPLSMRQAIVAIEDSRFYSHHGVDYRGTARAALANLKSNEVSQGGSTLTQQYVKNALLDSASGDAAAQAAATEQSAQRKLREARYALALERTLSKDQILSRYLNIAYFGNGVYGVGTAATSFFGKPVEQLTLAEGALLAGIVRNPTYYDVDSRDPEVRNALLQRRNTVLDRMRDLGTITSRVWGEATAVPLPSPTVKSVGRDCDAPDVPGGFFCDYVQRELETTDIGRGLGATATERRARLLAGGLTIRTSYDPRLQAAAQRAVDEHVPAADPSGVAAAADIVEPSTGLIRAMAVNRPYGRGPGRTQVNLATGGQLGVQPGSTFKVFFLAAAIAQGIPLSTSFVSPPTYRSLKNGCAQAKDAQGRPFAVSNAGDSQAGTFDLRSGTTGSVNTFYAQLAERTGLEKPLQLAEALGVRQLTSAGTTEPLGRNCTSYLGSATVSPLAIAGAYAALANHGLFCPPRAVTAISGPTGPVEMPANTCTQVLAPRVADTVSDVLAGVTGGTGPAAAIGRPLAGKTGTTNDNLAAWFAGYTPQLACAVWVGHAPAPEPMRGIRIDGRYYPEVFGNSLPAPIWAQIMREALAPLPIR